MAVRVEGTPPKNTKAANAATKMKGIYLQLGRAYGMLQGVSRNEVAQGYSLADAVRERIEQIEGTDEAVGELEKLVALEADIDDVVGRLQNVNIDQLQQELSGDNAISTSSTEGVTRTVNDKVPDLTDSVKEKDRTKVSSPTDSGTFESIVEST